MLVERTTWSATRIIINRIFEPNLRKVNLGQGDQLPTRTDQGKYVIFKEFIIVNSFTGVEASSILHGKIFLVCVFF